MFNSLLILPLPWISFHFSTEFDYKNLHLTLTNAKFNPLAPQTSSSMNSLSDHAALFLGIELKSIPSRVGEKFAPLHIGPLPIIYIWPHSWFLLDSHTPSSLCVRSAVITRSCVSWRLAILALKNPHCIIQIISPFTRRYISFFQPVPHVKFAFWRLIYFYPSIYFSCVKLFLQYLTLSS